MGLKLANELLREAAHLTHVDIPDVLRWKGIALLDLDQHDAALQTLTKARSLANKLGANPQLWLILSSLADVNEKLGNDKEGESNRQEARNIIEQLAESLREVGLAESFLEQPRVRAMMR